MSPADRRTDVRGCGREGDVAAYALGALDPGEVQQFRAHLETCAACREELADLRQVVDLLPMGVPQHAVPRRVRRRVLASVRNDARKTAQGDVPSWRLAIADRLPRPALAIAGLLAVAAIVVGGIELSKSSTSSPPSRVYQAKVIGERGSAKVNVTGGHAQLIVRDFSPPPPGKIYEVWLSRAGQKPTPTGVLFSVTASGDSDVDVPQSVHGVQALLVTPEPAGGSSAPTHTPVINAKLG